MSQENNPEEELSTESVVANDVEEISAEESVIEDAELVASGEEEITEDLESELEDESGDEAQDAYAEEEHEEVVVSRPQPLEPEKLQRVIEGALLASGQPMNATKILALFEKSEAPSKEEINDAFEAIAANCDGRGFELKQVASGWRFQVREESATWVNRLFDEKPQKYSRALLETLALIAYRQPITRGDIEEIRGVAVSSHIIKTLSERDWIKVVGHRDVPGRPSLYATTRQFLDYFNLKSLEELPSLGEISDLESLNPELELEAMPPVPVTPDLPVDVDDEDEADAEQEVFEGADTELPEPEVAESDADEPESPDAEIDPDPIDNVKVEMSEAEVEVEADQELASEETIEDTADQEEAFESADAEEVEALAEDDAPVSADEEIATDDEMSGDAEVSSEQEAAAVEVQDSVAEESAEANHDDDDEGPGITYKASEGSSVSSLFDSSPEEEV
jgi:segregation and condensation protein B